MGHSLEETFAKIQQEDRIRELHLMLQQMRKFLAGALCAVCGDRLGEDEEIIQIDVLEDEPATVHKRCEGESNDTTPETDQDESGKAEGNGEV